MCRCEVGMQRERSSHSDISESILHEKQPYLTPARDSSIAAIQITALKRLFSMNYPNDQLLTSLGSLPLPPILLNFLSKG